MCFSWFLIFLSAVVLCAGDLAINEVEQSMSAVKHKATFYAISNHGTIYRYNNISKWIKAREAFPKGEHPSWGHKPHNCELTFIGKQVLIYFATSYKGFESIGVAVAANFNGTFNFLNRPLLSAPNTNFHDPSAAVQGYTQQRFLVVSNGGSILSYPLTDDGISLKSTNGTVILKPDFEWEGDIILKPKLFYTRIFSYILYSAHACTEKSAIGVARGVDFLGPYEKLATPLLTSNKRHSAVNIVFFDEDTILFLASKQNKTCNGQLYSEPIGWEDQSWPYLRF